MQTYLSYEDWHLSPEVLLVHITPLGCQSRQQQDILVVERCWIDLQQSEFVQEMPNVEVVGNGHWHVYLVELVEQVEQEVFAPVDVACGWQHYVDLDVEDEVEEDNELHSVCDSWDTGSLRYLCGVDNGSLGLVLPDAIIQLQLH